MKFSVKNICVEFGGWSLEFARLRTYDFVEFREQFLSLPEDKYNEDGSVNFKELSGKQMRDLIKCTPEFMAKNLVSAKCEDETAETEREKLVLIDYLSDDAEFRTFCQGYINGEKKT